MPARSKATLVQEFRRELNVLQFMSKTDKTIQLLRENYASNHKYIHEVSMKGFSQEQFLDHWIRTVEQGLKEAGIDIPHIHFFADHSSGPNFAVVECRCGEDRSHPI